MTNPSDLTYYQLRQAIIRSYTSGDFDNQHNQLLLSLKYLDVHYNPEDFRDVSTVLQSKKRLLFKIQASVDWEMGRRLYMGE